MLLSAPVNATAVERSLGRFGTAASASLQGPQMFFEDAHILNQEQGVFGVFDGCFGDEAAALCAERMHLHALAAGKPSEASLATAFATCEEELRNNLPKRSSAGSTASFAMVTPDGDDGFKVNVASCGDSRAILWCKNTKTFKETKDHKPDVPSETMRIEAAGGTVWKTELWGDTNCNAPAKIDGQLTCSRALGAFHWKEDKSLKPEAQKVSALPEFYEWEAGEGDWLIIACGSLFHKLGTQKILHEIQKRVYPEDYEDDEEEVAPVVAARKPVRAKTEGAVPSEEKRRKFSQQSRASASFGSTDTLAPASTDLGDALAAILRMGLEEGATDNLTLLAIELDSEAAYSEQEEKATTVHPGSFHKMSREDVTDAYVRFCARFGYTLKLESWPKRRGVLTDRFDGPDPGLRFDHLAKPYIESFAAPQTEQDGDMARSRNVTATASEKSEWYVPEGAASKAVGRQTIARLLSAPSNGPPGSDNAAALYEDNPNWANATKDSDSSATDEENPTLADATKGLESAGATDNSTKANANKGVDSAALMDECKTPRADVERIMAQLDNPERAPLVVRPSQDRSACGVCASGVVGTISSCAVQ